MEKENVSIAELNQDEICDLVMKWVKEDKENRACIVICKEKRELISMFFGREEVLINIILNALVQNPDFRKLLIKTLKVETCNMIN